MSFNYVVRSVGYSLGSAIGGLVLSAGADRLFPNDGAIPGREAADPNRRRDTTVLVTVILCVLSAVIELPS
ncbi:hypothetical protein [Streptomyces sp. A30]|uniref:hypothetical protein n=1 Tax=Streptomyces sp. A30 TaxID=2789273 RepID=UPI00397F82F5